MATGEVKLRNSTKLLDAIEVIRKYKDLAKPSEVDMMEPFTLARLIIRRKIRDSFDGFNIRKNQHDYALRCDDERLYKSLYIAHNIVSNSSFMAILDSDLRDKVTSSSEQARNFIQVMTREMGIDFQFKDDNRLFIYISFLPMDATISNMTDFRRYSLLKRIETIDTLSSMIGTIAFDEIFDKLMILAQENNIYTIYRNITSLSEEFLDFYLSKPIGERRYAIQQVWTDYNRTRAPEVESETEEADIEENDTGFDEYPTPFEPIPSTSTTSVPRGFRLVEADNTATEEVSERPQEAEEEDLFDTPIEDIEVRVEEQHPGATPTATSRLTQEGFNELLRRVRQRREGDSSENPDEMAASLIEQLHSGMIARNVDHDPINGDYITCENLLLFLGSASIGSDEKLKITNVDMFDDIEETDKDGLYYTIIENKIIFYVFYDNEIIIETEDSKEAEDAFKNKFKTENIQLKYFRGDDVVENRH